MGVETCWSKATPAWREAPLSDRLSQCAFWRRFFGGIGRPKRMGLVCRGAAERKPTIAITPCWRCAQDRRTSARAAVLDVAPQPLTAWGRPKLICRALINRGIGESGRAREDVPPFQQVLPMT